MAKVKTDKKQSLAADIWRRFLRNKPAMVALVILCLTILVAIFANVLVSYDAAIKQDIMGAFTKPCREHPFGTDLFGRDVLARIIHGSRVSLLVGITTTAGSIILACIFGSIAGYFGGRVENIIMRIMDIFICIPGILFTICIVAILGSNVTNLIIALIIGQIPGYTRIVRSVILNLRGSDYLEASRAYGSSEWRIIRRHILPNAIGPIIVQATMGIATAIIAAASLSFIGLGAQPPTPEWGYMLSEAKDQMRNYPYLAIFPGIAIVITALCFNLMGDGLRDALDPRLKD